MYGTYGGYGGYGGYGVGYGGYGAGYGAGSWDDMTMVRQAEERTRSTFQSVESVVGAFASVSVFQLHCISRFMHSPFTLS